MEASRKTSDAYNSGDLSPRVTSPSHRRRGRPRGSSCKLPCRSVPMIYPSAPVRRQRLSVPRCRSFPSFPRPLRPRESRVDARLKPPYHELSSTTCWKVEAAFTIVGAPGERSNDLRQILRRRTINFASALEFNTRVCDSLNVYSQKYTLLN